MSTTAKESLSTYKNVFGPSERDTTEVNAGNRSGAERVLGFIFGNKKARAGMLAGAGVAGVSGVAFQDAIVDLGHVALVQDAYADGPTYPGLSNPGGPSNPNIQPGVPNPNYIPAKNSPVVAPTGPSPVAPLPGLPNPTVDRSIRHQPAKTPPTEVLPTITPEPTKTPRPTETPKPKRTPRPTETPKPTEVPPTATATPTEKPVYIPKAPRMYTGLARGVNLDTTSRAEAPALVKQLTVSRFDVTRNGQSILGADVVESDPVTQNLTFNGAVIATNVDTFDIPTDSRIGQINLGYSDRIVLSGHNSIYGSDVDLPMSRLGVAQAGDIVVLVQGGKKVRYKVSSNQLVADYQKALESRVSKFTLFVVTCPEDLGANPQTLKRQLLVAERIDSDATIKQLAGGQSEIVASSQDGSTDLVWLLGAGVVVSAGALVWERNRRKNDQKRIRVQ